MAFAVSLPAVRRGSRRSGKQLLLRSFRMRNSSVTAPACAGPSPGSRCAAPPARGPSRYTRPGQRTDIQRHQPLSGKASHLPRHVRVRGLLRQGIQAHHRFGHRGCPDQGCVRNPNLPGITDDHPQSRPRRQLSERAARAALLPASCTTRRDTIRRLARRQARMRVSVPCRPTRASSLNHTFRGLSRA